MADTGQRSTDSDLDRSIPLSKEAILEQCKTLCGQLKYDYVFMPVSSLFLCQLDIYIYIYIYIYIGFQEYDFSSLLTFCDLIMLTFWFLICC